MSAVLERNSAGRSWREWRFTAVSIVVLTLAWIGATEGGLVDDLFLPSPTSLWEGFVDLLEHGYRSRTILEHAALSLERVLSGFITGAFAGTLVGLGMGYDRKVEAFFSPLIEFLRPLP